MPRTTSFGFPTGELRADDITNPERVLQMGVEPVQIPVMSAISGVEWNEAWEGRERAAGRLKDLADAEALGEE